MHKLLIKNAWVIDPANKLDAKRDILIEADKITRVEPEIKLKNAQVIDGQNKIVFAGLVDMHVHLREPGREDKETVASGTRAALKGGVTSLLAMPNTEPAIDSVENIRLLKKIIQESACANVYIAATITKERAGKKLTNQPALKKAGAIAITDDGSSVDSERLMRQALKTACGSKLLVICHCEDKTLSHGGVVNLGLTSTRMGLRGISNASEYKRLERDILLAEKTKARIHIAHVSTKESVKLIAQAKKRGVKITAETAPHYFSLSEEAVWDYDANMKMNPPLRSKEDKEAIIQGLKDGTLDVIASDHAPHTENEKEIEFERAECGVIGLETLLAASLQALVVPGIISWSELIKKLSLNPSTILGIPNGHLSVGSCADLVIFDPEKEWVCRKEDFLSQSKNSCFLGQRFKGRVAYTICAGKIVYQEQ